MPTVNGLLATSKISNSHSTVIKVAQAVIKKAKSLDEVTSIIIGRITGRGTGQKRIKFKEIPAGWKVLVSGGGIQEIYLYMKPEAKEKIKREIEQYWESSK